MIQLEQMGAQDERRDVAFELPLLGEAQALGDCALESRQIVILYCCKDSGPKRVQDTAIAAMRLRQFQKLRDSTLRRRAKQKHLEYRQAREDGDHGRGLA